jgi:hypothetical protein
MAEEVKFVDGLIVKAPREGAPDFVKAAISIKVAELKDWLSTQEGEWVNLDVKAAKSGKWYASVSTYKPKDEQAKPSKPASNQVIDESDIPF